jgi:hypothetical protein
VPHFLADCTNFGRTGAMRPVDPDIANPLRWYLRVPRQLCVKNLKLFILLPSFLIMACGPRIRPVGTA